MYTYLIGWSKHDKYYYGVRYAKGAKPEELWRSYFTSSKFVLRFRHEHGEPDIVEVRRVFNDRESATLWEHKVLKRLKVNKNDKWLNKTYNGCFEFRGAKNTIPGAMAAAEKYRGKSYEEIFGEKAEDMRAIRKKLKHTEASKDKMRKPKDPAAKERYRQAAIRRWANKEEREKLCASMRVPKRKGK